MAHISCKPSKLNLALQIDGKSAEKHSNHIDASTLTK